MAAPDCELPNTGPAPQVLARCGAVVVAHARLDLARDCVASLHRWLGADRIVVVVNTPDVPGAADLAEKARVISPPAPQGYGANLNLGVRSLPDDVEFVVLANDDVVFGDDSLPRLLDALTDQRVGIAGPQLLNADGSPATSYGTFPRPRDALRAAAILPLPLWERAHRRPRIEPQPEFVVGAAMVVRRKSFEEVGGFDEDFFLNFEETDLCFRLRRDGWRVAWRGDAPVTHIQGSSISRPLNYETFYSSLRLYYAKRLGPIRARLFELLLAGVFAGAVVYSSAASLMRPRSYTHRLEEVRRRWRERLFLRRAPRRT